MAVGLFWEERRFNRAGPTSEWKAFDVRCFLKANAIATSDTCFEWHQEASEILDREIGNLGMDPKFVTGTLKIILRWLLFFTSSDPASRPGLLL